MKREKCEEGLALRHTATSNTTHCQDSFLFLVLLLETTDTKLLLFERKG